MKMRSVMVIVWITLILGIMSAVMTGCSSRHNADGWYPVADYPENRIEGQAIVTAKDFATVVLDTAYRPDVPVIVGLLKENKIKDFAEATEDRIGKRIGFVYKDSVIVAPTVNCRIEGGSFTIETQDVRMINEIYESLKIQME